MTRTSSPSPARSSEEPAAAPGADKSKRYDRGVRIWGAHGQGALENARICLLNCGPAGSEALKNLVLGGIHSFTIVDGKRVTQEDLGNNFLVTAGALGQSRAQCVTDCLKELNDTVGGSYVEESPEGLIASNPSFFLDFSLVIATQLGEGDAVELDRICRQRSIPLVLVRAYGLTGYLRVSIAEHRVIESKPDSTVDDMRLANPWPQLLDYVSSVDLAALDDYTHSHTPYAVILVKAALAWQAEHDALPRSASDRASFKDLIRSWQRSINDMPVEEENFQEAVASAQKVWAPPTISSELRAVLGDECAASVGPQTEPFWVLVAALKRFIDGEGKGLLPLEGSIPDMHASTQLYLELQRLYRDKAEADVEAVERHARALLEAAGRDPGSIPRAEVKHFCKHARYLRVVRCRSLEEETSPSSCRSEALRHALAGEESSPGATLYTLLRAADRFHQTYQRFPGVYDSEVEEDVALLKTAAHAVLAECGASGGGASALDDDLLAEVVRCGAGELHAVAAAVGAAASQEAIKLLTLQFVPIGGTLIYNAMAATNDVFAF